MWLRGPSITAQHAGIAPQHQHATQTPAQVQAALLSIQLNADSLRKQQRTAQSLGSHTQGRVLTPGFRRAQSRPFLPFEEYLPSSVTAF